MSLPRQQKRSPQIRKERKVVTAQLGLFTSARVQLSSVQVPKGDGVAFSFSKPPGECECPSRSPKPTKGLKLFLYLFIKFLNILVQLVCTSVTERPEVRVYADHPTADAIDHLWCSAAGASLGTSRQCNSKCLDHIQRRPVLERKEVLAHFSESQYIFCCLIVIIRFPELKGLHSRRLCLW